MTNQCHLSRHEYARSRRLKKLSACPAFMSLCCIIISKRVCFVYKMAVFPPLLSFHLIKPAFRKFPLQAGTFVEYYMPFFGCVMLMPYFVAITATVVAIEVSTETRENQNAVDLTLLPLTVACLAFIAFGSTYTTSFCCR